MNNLTPSTSLNIDSVAIQCVGFPYGNLFAETPTDWFVRPEDQDKAIELFDLQTEPVKQMLLATLSRNEDLYRFLQGPSSTSHHHSWRGGNFQHTLEVVENILNRPDIRPRGDYELAFAYAWFHDLGKARTHWFDEFAQPCLSQLRIGTSPNISTVIMIAEGGMEFRGYGCFDVFELTRSVINLLTQMSDYEVPYFRRYDFRRCKTPAVLEMVIEADVKSVKSGIRKPKP